MRALKMSFLPVLFLFLSLALLFFYYRREVGRHPAVGGAAAVSFVVNEGEGAAAVASNLTRQKLMSSPPVFRLYLFLNNLTNALQAGVFQIPPGASIKEIANILQHGKFDIKLTFIEGWRREETAKYLKSKIKSQKSKVDFSEEFMKESMGLEGYLFPDTYYVPTWFTAKQLVELMKNNFEKKLQALQFELTKNEQTPAPPSTKELIILASIVEREAKFPEDRPLVGGILIKRWKNNWPLEADATLQYALANQGMASGRWKREEFDFWPKQITAEDLKLDSPYNTRKQRGLPPAPISNPGLAALRAAFFPQESPYWFYLSDKTGRMHYAQTIEEHSRNIVQYLSE